MTNTHNVSDGASMNIRFTLVMVATALLMILATACGGNEKASTPSRAASMTTAQPSPTKPAWAAKYTDQQYADFQVAAARYSAYLAHDRPWLNADPKTAAAMVKEYFTPAEGLYQLQLIKFNRQHRLRADRNPTLLWTRMTRYGQTTQGQPRLAINACMDDRQVKAYQDGKLLTGPGVSNTPIIYTIILGRTPAGKWMISRLINPGIREVKTVPCHA